MQALFPDISGETIHVEDAVDLPFHAGSGTRLSDDGLQIYAAIDGQPSLDMTGVVSVYPELVIHGDVGYNTGNNEPFSSCRITEILRRQNKDKNSQVYNIRITTF